MLEQKNLKCQGICSYKNTPKYIYIFIYQHTFALILLITSWILVFGSDLIVGGVAVAFPCMGLVSEFPLCSTEDVLGTGRDTATGGNWLDLN